jgi:mono/diheme cytochrome c family protein
MLGMTSWPWSRSTRVLAAVLPLVLAAAQLDAKLSPELIAQLPEPAAHKIDFRTEVRPILEASCVKCHGRGKSKGGFRLDTRDTLLKGGDSGPAVTPGSSAASLLIEMVSGLDPDNVMPQKGSKLTRPQVGVLRAWIDQGLAWDAGVQFGRRPPLNLHPRRPPLPAAGAASKHPIDRLLAPYFESNRVATAAVVADAVFARRAWLDVIGLLPQPDEQDAFEVDPDPGKRARLVWRLLGDDQGYAQHWLSFWNDALRNDYVGTGYIDGGRKQITFWLYRALAQNLPYDRFAAQLINPAPGAEGFTKGIVWRGVVNASQTPPLQAAQSIAQVFLGVNLKCASCHDSFINDWSLAEAYGLASVYADEPLEIAECDKLTGTKATAQFLYPDLGTLDGTLDKPKRMQQLAGVVCGTQNGRLSRTIVNRLWARLFGRGLVEPVDDMEQPAWHPDLLDWLAEDLVEHDYNLRHTIERILTSKAYQMPATPLEERSATDYVFRGPAVRRLTAEQFRDAFGRVTGVWHDRADAEVDFLANSRTHDRTMFKDGLRPQWIWTQPAALTTAAVETVYWRRRIELPEPAAEAHAVVTADNRFVLFVNGNRISESGGWENPRLVDLRPYLLKGENVLAIETENSGDKPNPAGLLFYARIRSASQTAGPASVMDFASDASWRWSTSKHEHWDKPGGSEATWSRAVVQNTKELPDSDARHLDARFSALLSGPPHQGAIRTALVKADPMAIALGRPNREQVVTTRASAATTLQGLELTNGPTLAALIARGAEKLLNDHAKPQRALIDAVFQRALGRKPAPEEAALATELIGDPARKEGVEDLLWSVAMLPEFQLIF